MSKIIKDKCEICNSTNKSNLHLHHIIERNEIGSSNHPFNLAIVCPNCHSKIHNKEIIVYGCIPSTQLPNKRTLIYEIDGVRNINVEPIKIKLPNYKVGK